VTRLKPFKGYVLINSMVKSAFSGFQCLTIWTSRTRKGEQGVIVLTTTKKGKLTKASRDFLAGFGEGD